MAIILVLASLLMPAVRSARRRAIQTLCAGNLRQCGIAWRSYAHDHDGYYPRNYHPNGSLLGWGNWTLLTEELHDLIETSGYAGTGGKIFYCPLYKPLYGDKTDDWRNPRTDTNPRSYQTSYPIYGMSSSAQQNNIALGNDLPPLESTLDDGQSVIPLMFDETAWYSAYGFQFARHLLDPDTVDGGNALYGDGHVVWRPFETMIQVMEAGWFRRYY